MPTWENVQVRSQDTISGWVARFYPAAGDRRSWGNLEAIAPYAQVRAHAGAPEPGLTWASRKALQDNNFHASERDTPEMHNDRQAN